MTNKDIELVQDMELKYNKFKPVLENLEKSIDDFEKGYQDFIDLNHFYGSEKWFELHEEKEKPFNSGVLSEDQLYNMIGEHNELLGRLLSLTTKMYKNM